LWGRILQSVTKNLLRSKVEELRQMQRKDEQVRWMYEEEGIQRWRTAD
jgi:hypothetical protein